MSDISIIPHQTAAYLCIWVFSVLHNERALWLFYIAYNTYYTYLIIFLFSLSDIAGQTEKNNNNKQQK